MDFTNLGTISTIIVGMGLILVFVIGLVAITKTVKSVMQFQKKNYITSEEAASLKNQNAAIKAQLKELDKRNA